MYRPTIVFIVVVLINLERTSVVMYVVCIIAIILVQSHKLMSM